jgi:hypothetical protein
MVNVNTVYQTVLALADKDQGGYITPQEFNLFAKHAQNEIFEQYFYDLNQFKRVPGNQSDYADATSIIQDKISAFIETQDFGAGGEYELPSNFYRASKILVDGGVFAEKTSREQGYLMVQGPPLVRPTKSRPIFYLFENRLIIRPKPSTVYMSYIKRPLAANWTYIVSQNAKKPLYNASAVDHRHFELHSSEEKNLIHKILQLAGVSTKDFNTAQFANAEEAKSIQQEKS